MRKRLDFNEITTVADDYAARMDVIRRYRDNRKTIPKAYDEFLAPLKYSITVKACEALYPMVWRIRELEEQLQYLAKCCAEMDNHVNSAEDWVKHAEKYASVCMQKKR